MGNRTKVTITKVHLAGLSMLLPSGFPFICHFSVRFGEGHTYSRLVLVLRGLVACRIGDPDNTYLIVLELDLVVVGVHFDRILSQQARNGNYQCYEQSKTKEA